MEQFYAISDIGKIQLPTKKEISEIKSKSGEDVLLVLDSCVCLDVITLIKNKQMAKIEKQKVFNLIEYTQKNDVYPIPLLALPELCYDRMTFSIKEEKFWDFKCKLDFAFEFPYKLLKQYKFDYETNYYIFKKPELSSKSIEPFTEQLDLFYAALLKIRSLAKVGLSSQFAEKNILEFINWMVHELNAVLGPELSLAIQVFGGNTKFRTMIKPEGSKEKALKTLWGSAWDLLHARVSRNKSQLSQIVGRPVQPIFITKDINLHNLLAPHVDSYIKYNSVKLSITTNNNYPPHYSTTFMNELNVKLLDITLDRALKEMSVDRQKIKEIIRKLEEA
ncbi:MAG: hypothetical protein RIE86_16935 [Imperialibacter sp.]|uniref:hypothetical protein n=1 Tax=Imperialibacter sp. TaxID=2038411 RepID=UPI0032EF7EBD